MTTATLSFIKAQKNFQTRINSISFPYINWKAVCIAGFLMSLSLLVFYVFQVNDLTKGSYTINSYEKQIKNLSQENKNLEVSFAESSFLGQALAKIEALNFQKTTSVRYIQILDSSAEATAINKNM